MDKQITEPHINCLTELKMFLHVKNLKYNDLHSSAIAVAKYFRKLNPKSEKEYNYFYKTCNDYIYENAYWNNGLSCKRKIHAIKNIIDKYRFKNILEIGCGIGTDAIALKLANYNISVLKNDNYSFDFFEYRLKIRKLNLNIVKNINKQYDCIMFFDVIEHVFDPYKFLTEITKYTKSVLFTQAFKVHDEISGGFPQHFDYKLKDIQKHLESLKLIKQKIKLAVPPFLYIKNNSN